MEKENKVKIIAAVICVIILGVFYMVFGPGKAGEKEQVFASDAGHFSEKNETEADSARSSTPMKNDGSEAKSTETKVYIYVSGAVKNPGVYTFDRCPRAVEAVDKAGGFTKKADASSVNLALLLEDGTQLDIPRKGQSDTEGSSGGEVKQGSGVTTGGAGAGSPSQAGDRININTADESELMKIPGIGQAKAAAIISYRNEHGRFAKPEDIKNISGIKDGVYTKVKDYITV